MYKISLYHYHLQTGSANIIMKLVCIVVFAMSLVVGLGKIKYKFFYELICKT